MNKLLPVLVSALFIALGHTSLSHAQEPAAVRCELPDPATRESIVHIKASRGSTASGVVIAQDRVLTVAHAVDPGSKLAVNIQGVFLEAELIAVDEANDLALLSVPTHSLKVIPISNEPLRVEEPVWALGYPLAKKLRLSLGLYQSIYNGRLYTSTHVNSGVSGGGLLRCDAGQFALAGVVHGFVAQVKNQQYINIGDSTSVPAAAIQRFLAGTQQQLVMSHTEANVH